MSLIDRQAKKEIRQRGSARRNVSVDDFTIDPNKINKKKAASKLSSALIKSEDIDELPKLRRRDTLISNSLAIENDEVDAPVNTGEFDEQPFDFDYDLSNNNEYLEVPIKSEERSKQTLNRDMFHKSDIADFPSNIDSKHLPSKKSNVRLTNKNRKRKLKVQRESKDELSSGSEYELGKNYKSARVKLSSSKDKVAKTSPIRTRNLRSRKIVINEAIPLTKAKIKQKQKPLLIDLVRLTNEEKADRRHKIHTLDVIKYLIRDFQPRSDLSSSTLKEDILHADFKTHLTSNLENLMDILASTNDILNRLSEVQKLKNIFRSKIFEVRKEHSEIGNELNHLRSMYNKERDSFSDFNKIHSELGDITSKIKAISTNEDYEKENTSSHRDFSSLKNLMHPNLSSSRKLSFINDKLSQLNDKL